MDNTWQPIETAPKDGSDILLWGGAWRHPFVGKASSNLYMAWIDVPTPIAQQIEVFATHWMPLPAQPDAAARSAA